MIRDEGVHLVASAGDPQTEPGPQCAQWSRPLPRQWDTPRWLAPCAGCFGWHRRRLKLTGWYLEPHTPSPPQHDRCDHCGEPMDPPSYTNVGHPWCGYGDDSETTAQQ